MIQKTKHLYSITIDGIAIGVRLTYNLNTNHIGIGNSFDCQKKYHNQYRKDNKEKISKQNKEYYINNKIKIDDYNKQYYYNNREKLNKYSKECYYDARDLNTPIKGSLECRIKISCAKRKINIEDFDNFTHNQKYCPKFNESCREKNREKYNRKCFLCDKSEKENLDKFSKQRKLAIHHVDMNKDQGCNSEWILIPVCMECHPKLHTKEWQYRIEYILNLKGLFF